MASSNINITLKVTGRMSLPLATILSTANNFKQFICLLKSSIWLTASCNNVNDIREKMSMTMLVLVARARQQPMKT